MHYLVRLREKWYLISIQQLCSAVVHTIIYLPCNCIDFSPFTIPGDAAVLFGLGKHGDLTFTND